MIGKLNYNQLSNIEETLEDFKVLLTRYRSIKGDETKLKQFFVRNRNPIWDITGCKFFKTGLMSDSAKYIPSKEDLVDDHYIQRSKAMSFIFSELDSDENMGLNKFIFLLKKYCSTIKLSKEEHNKVTVFTKNSNYLNHEIYLECDIIIDGLSELLLN